jgi:HD-GYP domain-containing protein (c-di-GMP phosphodiesterase class II)
LKSYTLKEIPPESFFSEPVYLDDQFILTAPEVRFSGDLIKILEEWEWKEVRSGGEPRPDYAGEEEAGKGETVELSALNDGDRLKSAEEFYSDFLRFTESLFLQVLTAKKLQFSQIAEKIKEICDLSREQRRDLLRVLKSENSANYLASHALKSAILSIVIGHFIKLPIHRLMELGTAALVHEIGMYRLSARLYLSDRELTPEERKTMTRHPVLGFNTLKTYNFPLTASLPALEHHERENGSGYPQRLTGEKISLYSKIIAVACSYDALTSARPHKDAKDGYTGMIEFLKNEGKQYDDTIVKALVFSLSIYPIGLYVLLSNEKKGQVVDVNPENPHYPTVQILGELNPDGKNKIQETSREGIYIVRPLRREETGRL